MWIKAMLSVLSRKSLYKALMPGIPYSCINVNIGNSFSSSFANFMKCNGFSSNWYLQKVYYQKYKLMPPFLRPNCFDRIKKNAHRIEFVEEDVLDYLRKGRNGSVNKINFSDIFDWCSQGKFTRILEESSRVLTRRGLIFYRELLVSREIPKSVSDKFDILADEANEIHKKCNTPFYHRIVMLKKK